MVPIAQINFKLHNYLPSYVGPIESLPELRAILAVKLLGISIQLYMAVYMINIIPRKT